MTRVLQYPFTAAKVAELKLGDKVLVSGVVFTGRDRVHRHLAEGNVCPVNLADAAIYHCGPVMVREDGVWRVRAAGPTTSFRQEPYMARMIERHRLRVIIGKGGMGEATRRACVRHGCVYLQAVGGAASVIAACVNKVGEVHFLKEFGPTEAIWELGVQNLEAVVAIDARGRSLHDRVRAVSRRALRWLLDPKRKGSRLVS